MRSEATRLPCRPFRACSASAQGGNRMILPSPTYNKHTPTPPSQEPTRPMALLQTKIPWATRSSTELERKVRPSIYFGRTDSRSLRLHQNPKRLQQQPPIDDTQLSAFLDLPPELRNKIYRHCLTTPISCWLSVYQDKNSRLHKWALSQKMTPNLLLACRQIHSEAVSILYAENTFRIEQHTNEFTVAKIIGTNVGHLRVVEIDHAKNQAIFKTLLNGLRGAQALDRFIVGSGLHTNFRTTHNMAKGLLPLLRMLHRTRRGTDKKQALDVLEFSPHHLVPHIDASEWVRSHVEAYGVFTEEVRRILQGILRGSLPFAIQDKTCRASTSVMKHEKRSSLG